MGSTNTPSAIMPGSSEEDTQVIVLHPRSMWKEPAAAASDPLRWATLAQHCGLDTGIKRWALDLARPWCPTCCVEVPPPTIHALNTLPPEGFIALAVAGDPTISVAEQCELLGVERAIIGGLVCRPDPDATEEGSPVIALVSANNAEEISRAVSSWFQLGGGVLDIFHVRDRHSTVEKVMECAPGWRCGSCGGSFLSARDAADAQRDECSQCRGKGWLVGDAARFVACRECHGSGYAPAPHQYRVAEVPVEAMATLSSRELCELSERVKEPFAEPARQIALALAMSDLADLPLGFPLHWLSPKQQLYLSLVISRLSHLRGVVLSVRAGEGGECTTLACAGIGSADAPEIVVEIPCATPKNESVFPPPRGWCSVGGISRGPFENEVLRFPLGTVTAVQGGRGCGKSLLLEEIQRRFLKRRKEPLGSDFGDLSHVEVISGEERDEETLVDLLGLTGLIAHEIAQSRSARSLGVRVKDLETVLRARWCTLCSREGWQGDGRCEECRGRVPEGIVLTVQYHGVSLVDLLATPVERAATLPWFSGEVCAAFEGISALGYGALVIGDSGGLDFSGRRFLRVFGRLAQWGGRVARGSHSTADRALVCIDECWGTERDGVLFDGVLGLVGQGGTVLAVDLPETLVSSVPTVVRLRGTEARIENPWVARWSSPFYDHRFSRKSVIVAERAP